MYSLNPAQILLMLPWQWYSLKSVCCNWIEGLCVHVRGEGEISCPAVKSWTLASHFSAPGCHCTLRTKPQWKTNLYLMKAMWHFLFAVYANVITQKWRVTIGCMGICSLKITGAYFHLFPYTFRMASEDLWTSCEEKRLQRRCWALAQFRALLCEQSQDPGWVYTLPDFPPGTSRELLEFNEPLLTKG